MMSLHLFSPAKINLFLHITGKRADGYHDLQSVFRALDFGDDMTFDICPDAQDLISLTGADTLCAMQDNLITKATFALAKYTQNPTPVSIHLTKRIPTGAGLGGGSSNCATTLLALNQLWQIGLNTDELMKIGATLGADVPFFIFNHAHQTDAIASSIGEILHPITLPKRRYLLLTPDAHLSTANVFAHPSLTKNTPCLSNDDIIACRDDFDLVLNAGFFNCFEPIVLSQNTAVKQALAYLYALKGQTSHHATPRMTGTGSVVYLPLTNDISDDTLHTWQTHAPCPAIIGQSLHGV